MEIVAVPGSKSDRRVSPRPSLFTVCDENVAAKTFIHLSNHKEEEAVSRLIEELPTHLDQSGGVSVTSPPLPSMLENMESTHVDYKYQIFLIGKEVELDKSTHPLSRD